jgi:SPP1 gp7 family putative phage head morphogenesis protein
MQDTEYDGLVEELTAALGPVAKDGAKQALRQVSREDEIAELLELANENAIDWAGDHAGELVTAIGETTRDGVRALVMRAEDEGWSNDRLADALQEAPEFGEARAEMIARTETAFADVSGNLIGWRASGVVEWKQWSVAQDEVCDLCNDMDGTLVALDDTFDFGGEQIDGPPGHPNCRCDVLPVLSEEEEEEES